MKINKSMADAFYSEIDPRRRQEIKDCRMIQEDHSKVANCPEREINIEYDQNYFKYDQNSAARPSYNIFNDEVEAVPSRRKRGEYNG